MTQRPDTAVASTAREIMECEGQAHVPFKDWIREAREYATRFYGSDAELGGDEDMRQFYDDGYDHQGAVDEVFTDGR